MPRVNAWFETLTCGAHPCHMEQLKDLLHRSADAAKYAATQPPLLRHWQVCPTTSSHCSWAPRAAFLFKIIPYVFFTNTFCNSILLH